MTMDASQFRRELLQISREMSEAQREFSNATASIDSWRGSIDAATKRQELLNQRLLLQERRVQAYSAYLRHLTDEQQRNNDTSAKTRREIERTTKDLENVTAQYQRYQRQLWEAQDVLSELVDKERRENSEVGRLTKTMREQEAALDSLVMEYQNAVAQFGRMSTEARTAENRMNSMNDELRETRSQLERMGSLDIRNRTQISPLQLFGIGTGSQIAADVIQGLFRGLARATEEAVREFIDFESAFAGVKRTVEGSEQDFKLLRGEIMHLGTELATPVNEIADIAAIAGQMGIGVDQISEFTRVMIQLGDTTNVSAEEAGQSLAQLSNLLGLTADEYERMGSAIVQLGNEYPTTEQDIIDMSSRLAGMAGQVSMTASDVLGLANALAAVGLEAEMGGNTISKTLREMLMAVENNTSALALFASTADMSVSEFSELFRKDATQALSMFIEGLDDTARNGRSATQILRELSITETRQIDTLLRLSGNTGLLAESIQTANSAWDENIALARESAARYETTESRIEMMKNAWRNVAISIGDFFSPAIDGAIGLATDFANMLTGGEMASYDLEGELDVLIKTLDDYKKAQDAAASSTDIATQMMLNQASAAQIAAGGKIADTTNTSMGVIDSMIKDYEYALNRRNEAEERMNRFLNDSRRNVLGLESYEDILAYVREYERNIEINGASGSINHTFSQLRGMVNMWNESNSQMQSSLLDISDDIANVNSMAMRLGEMIGEGSLDMFGLESFLSNLDKDAQPVIRSLIDNIVASQESALKYAEMVISQNEGDMDALNRILEIISQNQTDEITGGQMGSFTYGFNLNLIKYLEDYIAELDTAKQATDEFVSNVETVEKVSDLLDDFRRSLSDTQQYNIAMNITGDEAATDEMSEYQKVIRDLISQRADYADAIGKSNVSLEEALALAQEYDDYALSLEGKDIDKARDAMLARLGLSSSMTREVFRENLEQLILSDNAISDITDEYWERFAEQLAESAESTDFEEIVASYNAELAKINANEDTLGDSFDRTAEISSLLDSTLQSLLDIDPSQRTDEWLEFTTALVHLAEVYSELDINRDYASLESSFYDISRMIARLPSIGDEALRKEIEDNIASEVERLYRRALEVDMTGWTPDQIANYEYGMPQLEAWHQIYRRRDETPESTPEGNWWTRTIDRMNTSTLGAWGIESDDAIAKYYEDIEGINDLVNDLQDVWSQIGEGILDTINMWFDAQLDAIDRAIDHLEESLEREQELLDYQANRQQAMLNKQLEEGLITEEQYNEASRLNKEHTEAAKYEAEIEGQNRMDELNAKREEMERRQFEAEKANSIAQVLISAAQGIAAAWTNPWSAPYITGLIAAMAAVQTGIIASQQYTPALAKGGIVSSPTTALIGEDGAEAVIPLQNNLEWIDTLAERISGILDADMALKTIDRYSVKDGERIEPLSKTQNFTQIINSPKALSRIDIYRDTRRLFKQFGRN